MEDGDTCHVILRNPQLVPGDQMAALATSSADAAENEKMTRIYGLIAELVIGWRVWDASVPVKADTETGELIHDEETAPRLLPLPATAESVGKLPQEILMAVMGKVTQSVNPQQIPASQGATGNPS